MADLSYTVDVNTSPAQRNLDRLNDRVNKVNDTFGKLKGAIAGLAIGAAITNVIRLADSIQDVSDATGFATQNILGFERAVALNGGSAEQAQQSIIKFVQSINEAADGGKNAQSAFADIGVTLRDLQTLSEQDLLAKTIEGLSKIDDAGKRVSITAELLGKNFRGVNIKGVADQLGSATQSSIQYVKAIQQTAEMQNKLDIAFQKLQLSILKAIQPLVQFINNIDDEKLGQFIEAIVKIGAVMGALAAATYVVQKALRAIGIVLFEVGQYALIAIGAIATIRGGFVNLGTTVGKTLESLSQWFRQTPRFAEMGGRVQSLTKLFGELGARFGYLTSGFLQLAAGIWTLINPFARLVAGIYLVIDAFKQLGEGKGFGDILDDWALKLETFVTQNLPLLAKGINALNDLLGMEPSPLTKQQQDPRAALRKQEIADAEKLRNEEKKRVANLREVTASYEKQAKSIKDGVDNFMRQNREAVRAIEFETELVGKTEEVVEMQRALNDVTLKYSQEINSLVQARDALDGKEQGLISVYNEQINRLREQLNVDKERTSTAIQGLQTAKILEEDRKRQIENTTRAIEAQIERQRALGDTLVSANDKMKEIRFDQQMKFGDPLEGLDLNKIPDQIKFGTKAIQIEYAKIQEEARKAALEAGRAFAAGFEGADLSVEQAQELANGLNLIAERYKMIAQAQADNLMASRTWEQGWKEAFDNYMENATNAARQAGEVFTSITGNMERAIDNFVTTGKFSFGDLARSIIQDLIKIELKAQATAMFKAVAGTAGTFLTSLFGFANGGTPPVNKPSIVGEKGPELFVPKTNGTIIPNHALAGAGGMMNAPITNNYITNNISAVDARSVAQLFAENRKTLLGTVRMAEKELPYSNR